MGRVLAIPLLVCLLPGCTPRARTEVVVGIATDLGAPVPLTRVTLQAYRTDVASQLPFAELSWSLSAAGGEKLPGSVGLFSPDGDEAHLRVVVSGLGSAGEELLSRAASFSLIRGHTLFLRMGLVSTCVGRSCGEGATCVEGRCAPAVLDSSSLPPYRPGMEGQWQCASGTSFIDTATGRPLTVAGAGACSPGDFCREATCYHVPSLDASLDLPFDMPADLAPDVGPDARQDAVADLPLDGPGARGAACSSAAECESGWCEQNRCCDKTCGALCVSCALAGKEGTCSPVPSGQDPRDQCVDNRFECGTTGACDGKGSCATLADGDACTDPACNGNMYYPPYHCESGTCRVAAPWLCDEYSCDLNGCKTTCTGDIDCAPASGSVTYRCNTSQSPGVCLPVTP